jgi:hypothetical protein
MDCQIQEYLVNFEMKYVPSADINIENKIAVTMLNEVLI